MNNYFRFIFIALISFGFIVNLLGQQVDTPAYKDANGPQITKPDRGADEFLPGPPSTPIITNVARPIRVPLTADTLLVTATITDTIGVDFAEVLYTVNGGTPVSVLMTMTGGTINNGTYQGIIPGSANANGNRVEYQVKATSLSGPTRTTAISAANSYFAGLSPLSLTGVRAMGSNGQILYTGYYCRVTGTVNSPNFTVLAGRISYMFQDAVGGMNISKASTLTPALALGDSVIVVGSLGQFRGMTQLTPDNAATDITIVASGRPVAVTEVTVAAYMADPETYESRLIRMRSLQRIRPTPVWGGNTSIPVYQYQVSDSTIMFIDADTDLHNTPEPAYPVTTTGISTQYTSSSSIYNNGYQIAPRFTTDFKSAVSGNINVGIAHALKNLKSIATFLADTNNVLGGPVTFLLTDATYSDTAVVFGNAIGSSSINTVTIKPAPGVSPVLTLRSGVASGFGIQMVGVKNFIIDGSNSGDPVRHMTMVMDTLPGAPTGVTWSLANGLDNVTFKNITLLGYRVTATASTTISFGNSTAATRNKNLTFDNLAISRGFHAISGGGFSSAALDSNIVIRNSLIWAPTSAPTDSFTLGGITLTNVDKVQIHNNTISGIRRPSGFAANNTRGIWITGLNVDVYNNRIHSVTMFRSSVTTSQFALGIVVQGISGTIMNPQSKIYNNMVYDISNGYTGTATQWVTGIYTDYGSNDQLYYNSVYLAGTTSTVINSAAYYMLRSTAISKNNILFNARTDAATGRAVAFWKNSVDVTSVITSSDYNNLYATWAARGFVAAVGDSNYKTLAIWRPILNQDQNSVSADPRFDMANPLKILTNVATPVESRATPVAGITSDFFGTARDAAKPDIGAHEGIFVPYTLGQIAASFDSTNATVTISWSAPSGAKLDNGIIDVAISEAIPNPVENKSIETTVRKKYSGISAHPTNTVSEIMVPKAVENRPNFILPQTANIVTVEADNSSDVEDIRSETEYFTNAVYDELDNQIIEPTENTELLIKYFIYRSVDGGAFALRDSVSATASNYTDNLVQARSYRYYLTAQYDNGSSAPSDIVTINVPFIKNEVEPNNTPATANYIGLGTALNANLSPAGDVDWFRFTGPVGHLVVDGTDASNLTDVDLYLYDSTGTNLLYNVDRNTNDRLEYNLAYAGTYYVNVKGYQNATGPYTLFARISTGTDPLEPDDGPLFGFPLIATWVESIYRDSLSTIDPGVGLPGFDIDYRYIRLTAGQQITTTLKTKTVFPTTTMNGGYLGIGRKGSSATLIPQVFGGSPLASGVSTTGTDVVVVYNVAVTDTYYVFVSVHLQAPTYGMDQAGPNARYQIIIDRTVGIEPQPEIPTEYALSQNYPNPFNPTTNIKFALPEASIVTVEVYNVLGQKVKTLINEERPAGHHIIEWDGRNSYNQFAGSGAYYLRISAEGNSGKKFTQVRKMMMMR